MTKKKTPKLTPYVPKYYGIPGDRAIVVNKHFQFYGVNGKVIDVLENADMLMCLDIPINNRGRIRHQQIVLKPEEIQKA